jgi:hypothetical protein
MILSTTSEDLMSSAVNRKTLFLCCVVAEFLWRPWVILEVIAKRILRMRNLGRLVNPGVLAWRVREFETKD